MKGVPSKLAEDHVANATACTLCGSGNLGRFVAETCIHFQGLENIDKPTVLVFPELVVCLDCGFTTLLLLRSNWASWPYYMGRRYRCYFPTSRLAGQVRIKLIRPGHFLG